MSERKTSTFVMHHDRCKPAEWGLSVWTAFDRFARTGDLAAAAALSRHGLQLAVSEHHEPAGGVLQPIGYVSEAEIKNIATEDLNEVIDDDVTAVIPVYRGPTKYAVSYAIGDDEGNVEGHEFEVMDTEAKAVAFLEGMHGEAPSHDR